MAYITCFLLGDAYQRISGAYRAYISINSKGLSTGFWHGAISNDTFSEIMRTRAKHVHCQQHIKLQVAKYSL